MHERRDGHFHTTLCVQDREAPLADASGLILDIFGLFIRSCGSVIPIFGVFAAYWGVSMAQFAFSCAIDVSIARFGERCS
jgi:hypothetical protein